MRLLSFKSAAFDHDNPWVRILSSWREDKAWADAHLQEIQRVVRGQLGSLVTIVASNAEQDREHAIDYVVKVDGGHIACRIRRAQACPYRDLTITALRPKGSIPEVQKILNRDVRWYLYAWARDGVFVDWMFVDLEVVRREGLIGKALRDRHLQVHPDGSKFIHISFTDLSAHGAIVDSTLGR